MKNNKINTKTPILTGIIFLLIGVFYTITATKIYQVDSQVLLLRNKFDSIELGTEESRNRWIWIRDGLNLKSLIVTDIDLNKFLAENKIENEFNINALKKMIEIQYTGADNNNYIITVKGSDKNFIYKLSNHLFDRIKYLSTEKSQEEFSFILENLKKDSVQVPNNSIEQSNYQAQIRKIILAQSLDRSQRQNAFQIIQAPTLKEDPIWPRSKIIILTMGILGLLTGIFLDMGINYYKNINQKNP